MLIFSSSLTPARVKGSLSAGKHTCTQDNIQEEDETEIGEEVVLGEVMTQQTVILKVNQSTMRRLYFVRTWCI